MIWDPKRVKIADYYMGNYSITIFCKIGELDVVWPFTRVYGLVNLQDKLAFREELNTLGWFWEGPWLLSRDFNAARKRLERTSNQASRFERESFNGFVDDFGLLEF